MAVKQFLFDKRVDRTGRGSLKEMLTARAVLDAGLVSYRGAELEFPACPAFSQGVRACAEQGLYAFTPQGEAYNQRIAWWQEHVRGWRSISRTK